MVAGYDPIQESVVVLLTLENPPTPVFTLRWNEEARAWCSSIAPIAELPGEIREVFEGFGHGCLAAETNAGVVHVCHAGRSHPPLHRFPWWFPCLRLLCR
jgi:hypothetical protein